METMSPNASISQEGNHKEKIPNQNRRYVTPCTQKDTKSNLILQDQDLQLVPPTENINLVGLCTTDLWPVRNFPLPLPKCIKETGIEAFRLLQNKEQLSNTDVNYCTSSDVSFPRAPGYERWKRKQSKLTDALQCAEKDTQSPKIDVLRHMCIPQQNPVDKKTSPDVQEQRYYNMWETPEFNTHLKNIRSRNRDSEMWTEDLHAETSHLENSDSKTVIRDERTMMTTPKLLKDEPVNIKLQRLHLKKIVTLSNLELMILKAYDQVRQTIARIREVHTGFPHSLYLIYIEYMSYIGTCMELKKHIEGLGQKLKEDIKCGFSIDISCIDRKAPALPTCTSQSIDSTSNGDLILPSSRYTFWSNLGYPVCPNIIYPASSHINNMLPFDIWHPLFPSAVRMDLPNPAHPVYLDFEHPTYLNILYPNFGYTAYPSLRYPVYPIIERQQISSDFRLPSSCSKEIKVVPSNNGIPSNSIFITNSEFTPSDSGAPSNSELYPSESGAPSNSKFTPSESGAPSNNTAKFYCGALSNNSAKFNCGAPSNNSAKFNSVLH